MAPRIWRRSPARLKSLRRCRTGPVAALLVLVPTAFAGCSDAPAPENHGDQTPGEHLEVPTDLRLTVPNLVGSCASDAVALGETLRFVVDFSGQSRTDGIVVAQVPPPGATADADSVVTISVDPSAEC